MPLELRVVFVLREIEQLANSEIADVIGIPMATVESRLREAEEDFATHLEAESELSLSLISAAREEQPPLGALQRALAASGIDVPVVKEANALRSLFAGSVRQGSAKVGRSAVQLAAKWLILGVLAGLAVSSVVYAVSDGAAERNARAR